MPTVTRNDDAARCLKDGGIVCYPTETFYGLAVDCRSEKAVQNLVALKGGRGSSPIGLIAGSFEQVLLVAEPLCPAALKLAQRFWPGPLSLVLRALPGLPDALVNEDQGVSIRVSPNTEASSLAQEFGSPITATSANPSGRPPAKTVLEAQQYFGDAVGVYIDGGPARGGLPSTVAEVRDGSLVIHRKGAVDLP